MRNPKVLVTGSTGLVGNALMITLFHQYGTVFNCDIPTSEELDLTDQDAVFDYMVRGQYDHVYHCAGHVGGIGYNVKHPGQMFYDNLMMQTNILEAARVAKNTRVLIIGSSCIYPKDKEVLSESDLMTGPLEETNKAYAIAKIAGLQMVDAYNKEYGTDFRAVMPCNMYGPHDTYDLKKSHVIPAMIMKFHEAVRNKEPRVVLWGTGTPLREFMYSGDFAAACRRVMTIKQDKYQDLAKHGFINVGSGQEVSIYNLAMYIKKMTGYNGHVVFDNSHPDGTKRKLLDSKLIQSLGWAPVVDLELGLNQTYIHFKKYYDSIRKSK